MADALRAEILGAAAGEGLPTEARLVERFGVSRFTVRAALTKLADEGLIQRRRGSGTVVADGHGPLKQRLGEMRDLLQYAAASHFVIEADGEVRLGAKAARMLGRPVGERWLHVTGTRRMDGERAPIALTEVWLHPRFAPWVPELRSGRETLFAQLRRLAGVEVARVAQEMSAVAASPRHALALGVPRRSPCLRIVRIYHSADGEPVEMSASVHPGARFSYAMELAA